MVFSEWLWRGSKVWRNSTTSDTTCTSRCTSICSPVGSHGRPSGGIGTEEKFLFDWGLGWRLHFLVGCTIRLVNFHFIDKFLSGLLHDDILAKARASIIFKTSVDLQHILMVRKNFLNVHLFRKEIFNKAIYSWSCLLLCYRVFILIYYSVLYWELCN